MADVRARFDTFISGYSESKQHHIPSDVTQLIMNIITQKLYIHANIINFEKAGKQQWSNEIEIFLDEITSKFRTPSYYQMDAVYLLNESQTVRFKETENKHEIASQIMSESPDSMKIDRTVADKFYEHKHCLSFLSFKFGIDCNAIYQISAVDRTGAVIIKTKWRLYENDPQKSFQGPRFFPPPGLKSEDFFKKTFGVNMNDSDSINIEQWLDGLRKEEISNDNYGVDGLCLCTKYYYYIQFIKNNESNGSLMTSADFKKYVIYYLIRSNVFPFIDVRNKIIKRIPRAPPKPRNNRTPGWGSRMSPIPIRDFVVYDVDKPIMPDI